MTNLPDLPQPSDACFDAAHERLMRGLEPHRAYYGWVDAPVGTLFVARTERRMRDLINRLSRDEFSAQVEDAVSRFGRPSEHAEQLLRAVDANAARLEAVVRDELRRGDE